MRIVHGPRPQAVFEHSGLVTEPRGAKPGLFPEKIRTLNALYEAAFKDDPKVTFCDTWTLFDDGQGSCKKEEFPDLLHPNAAGYAKWTAALTPIFEQLGLGK